jgi:hypothetical protein
MDVDDSDADSEGSHDLESVIDHVDNCIRMLEVAEGCTYLQFHAPKEDDAVRVALWAKHKIQEQHPIEQLESLLQSLATEERSGPWFKWLLWVLFGDSDA